MAQYFPFVRTATEPFQFLATLTGVQYQCVVTWNLAGQRWYLNIYTTAGALVLAVAAVPSDSTHVTNLIAGYFAGQSLYFDQPNNQFVVTP